MRKSFKVFIVALVLAILAGMSTRVVIIMYQGSQCESPQREGSLPALLCPAPTDNPSFKRINTYE